IIEIKISELQNAVCRADPHRWRSRTECRLANKVSLGFQDTCNLSNGLVLVPKQLQRSAAADRIERFRLEGQRECTSSHVIHVAEPLLCGQTHGSFEHLGREIEPHYHRLRRQACDPTGKVPRAAGEIQDQSMPPLNE